MREIYILSGEELESIRRSFAREGIWQVAATVDGGLKIKVNGGVWSPPMGELLELSSEPITATAELDMSEAPGPRVSNSAEHVS